MKSLFDSAESAAVTGRLRSLSPEARAAWGKMDVAQMLAHCKVPLQAAMGDVQLKRSFLGRLLGGLVKKKVVGPEPFKQGLPTDARFRMTDPHEFAAEQTAVLELVGRFSAGPEVLTTEPHLFFGALTPAEWDTLMWKHLDHHLRQFNA